MKHVRCLAAFRHGCVCGGRECVLHWDSRFVSTLDCLPKHMLQHMYSQEMLAPLQHAVCSGTKTLLLPEMRFSTLTGVFEAH